MFLSTVSQYCLVRIIKSASWEMRLNQFAALFSDYRADLKMDLSLLTVEQVTATNHTLRDVVESTHHHNDKLDLMLLFRELETPRERSLKQFITTNGGARACLDNDVLFRQLVILSDGPTTTSKGSTTRNRKDGVTQGQGFGLDNELHRLHVSDNYSQGTIRPNSSSERVAPQNKMHMWSLNFPFNVELIPLSDYSVAILFASTSERAWHASTGGFRATTTSPPLRSTDSWNSTCPAHRIARRLLYVHSIAAYCADCSRASTRHTVTVTLKSCHCAG